jgi:glycosyltransferase involved in cell wall biosynthesis
VAYTGGVLFVPSDAAVSRARVAAIIPAYDAARTLSDVTREAVAAFRDIGDVIVVDDGSSDETAARAAAAGAIVVRHDKNRGKGAALRTGLEEAERRGHIAAVTLDADGQHPIDEAVRLAKLDASSGALVLGIRDLQGAGAPRANQISNAISNGFLSFFSRKLLADTQCGLRRYPLPLARWLGGKDDGYAFEAEIILLAIAAGASVIEEPIRVLYPEDRTTHFDSVRDPMRVVSRVVKTLVATRWITRRAPA